MAGLKERYVCYFTTPLAGRHSHPCLTGTHLEHDEDVLDTSSHNGPLYSH